MSNNFLLQGEDVVVEELVQLLVRVVDAQLLKTVHPKVFEPKDVQNSQKSVREQKLMKNM